jgi:hypothetical protein
LVFPQMTPFPFRIPCWSLASLLSLESLPQKIWDKAPQPTDCNLTLKSVAICFTNCRYAVCT